MFMPWELVLLSQVSQLFQTPRMYGALPSLAPEERMPELAETRWSGPSSHWSCPRATSRENLARDLASAAKSCFSEIRTCEDAMVRRPTLRRARSIIRVMVAIRAKPLLTCLIGRLVKCLIFMKMVGSGVHFSAQV